MALVYTHLIQNKKRGKDLFGLATQLELRNFHKIMFKPNPNPKYLIMYPVIDSGQLYVYMPFSGHPASAKAIAAMKKKPQPLSLTWHVVENTILTQWFPTKQAAAHFFDSLQKNEDFNIINLDEAKAQFKAMKMIRNTPTK
jgi:hypothetical protein